MNDEGEDYGQEEFIYDISSSKSKVIENQNIVSNNINNDDERKSIVNQSKLFNESIHMLSENSEIKRNDSRKDSIFLPKSLINRKSYIKNNCEEKEIPVENFLIDKISEEKNENQINIEQNIKKYFNSNNMSSKSTNEMPTVSKSKINDIKTPQSNDSNTLEIKKYIAMDIKNFNEMSRMKTSNDDLIPQKDKPIINQKEIKNKILQFNSTILPPVPGSNQISNLKKNVKYSVISHNHIKLPYPNTNMNKMRPFSYNHSHKKEKSLEKYISSTEENSNEKHNNVTKEIKDLERDNQELRRNLILLNKEVNKVIDKVYHDQTRKDNKTNFIMNEKILDKEIETSNKILTTLINEYNTSFKKFYLISDPDYIKNIKSSLIDIDKQAIDYQNINKKIGQQNKLNENDLIRSFKLSEKSNGESNIEFKIQYYQENIEKNKIEVEKLNNQIEIEEENYKKSFIFHQKWLEIYNNYEKDRENTNTQIDTLGNEAFLTKKKNNLLRKIGIIENSRQVLLKSFQSEKESKRKIIVHLEKELLHLQEKLHERFILDKK